MAAKKKTASKTPNPVIASNKKAAFNYFFEERHEAGMVLQGWKTGARGLPVLGHAAAPRSATGALGAGGGGRVRPARGHQI